jgi:hypothetical protein
MVPISQLAEGRKVSLCHCGSRLANLRRVQMRVPLATAHKEGSQPLSEVRKNADAANALERTLTYAVWDALYMQSLRSGAHFFACAIGLLWGARSPSTF